MSKQCKTTAGEKNIKADTWSSLKLKTWDSS
jgi:hypothetical protein